MYVFMYMFMYACAPNIQRENKKNPCLREGDKLPAIVAAAKYCLRQQEEKRGTESEASLSWRRKSLTEWGEWMGGGSTRWVDGSEDLLVVERL